MKFNLKNFPKREDYPILPAGCTEFYTKAVEKWKKGFDQEIRTILKFALDFNIDWQVRRPLKEILGE